MVHRVPYVEQNIIFKREYNKHDRFAVASKTVLKGRIAPLTVRHAPRGISHTWCVIQEGGTIRSKCS